MNGAADKNPLLEYMMKVKKEEAVHSSGYARAVRGERIGTTSAESFAARQAMEANRQVVRRYKESKVGDARNTVERAKGYDAGKEAEQRAAIRERFGGDKMQTGGSETGSTDETKGPSRFAGPSRIEGSAPTRRNPGISR